MPGKVRVLKAALGVSIACLSRKPKFKLRRYRNSPDEVDRRHPVCRPTSANLEHAHAAKSAGQR
jgi:hypothetical protein